MFKVMLDPTSPSTTVTYVYPAVSSTSTGGVKTVEASTLTPTCSKTTSTPSRSVSMRCALKQLWVFCGVQPSESTKKPRKHCVYGAIKG